MEKSPRSPKTPTKFNYEKDDSSFWEKFSTLGRKKKIKEGERLQFMPYLVALFHEALKMTQKFYF
jgi:hypothetical protein